METQPLPPALGEAKIPRYLVDEHHVVIAIADFDPLFRAYLDHARRWDREPDPFESVLMRQALAGTCLYLSGRRDAESRAWTINLHKPALNVFVTGDAADDHVTARLFTENIVTSEASRMYCQVQPHAQPDGKPLPLRETVIEVSGLDVLRMFETFCKQSDQGSVRFFDYEDSRSAMVVGLPGCDPDWIAALDRERTLELVENARLLETRQFAFACGCSEEKMFDVVSSVYEGRPDALFQGEEGVEVQCPRCGHEWLLRRTDFK